MNEYRLTVEASFDCTYDNIDGTFFCYLTLDNFETGNVNAFIISLLKIFKKSNCNLTFLIQPQNKELSSEGIVLANIWRYELPDFFDGVTYPNIEYNKFSKKEKTIKEVLSEKNLKVFFSSMIALYKDYENFKSRQFDDFN
jgi:nitrogen fixation protein